MSRRRLIILWMSIGIFALVSVCFLMIVFVFSVVESSPKQLPVWLRDLQAGSTVYYNIVTPIAVVVGGLFFYYRLILERTHASRIQPTVDIELDNQDDLVLLKVSASGTNIGNSQVQIAKQFCGTRLYTRRAHDDRWHFLHAQPIYQAQGWFEPGETLAESVLFEFYKSDWIVARVEVYIAQSRVLGWYVNDLISLTSVESYENLLESDDLVEQTEGWIKRLLERISPWRRSRVETQSD